MTSKLHKRKERKRIEAVIPVTSKSGKRGERG
jgi:hypothetical protein